MPPTVCCFLAKIREIWPHERSTPIDFNKSDFRRHRDRINEELLSVNLDDQQQRTSLEQEVTVVPTDIVGTAVASSSNTVLRRPPKRWSRDICGACMSLLNRISVPNWRNSG